MCRRKSPFDTASIKPLPLTGRQEKSTKESARAYQVRALRAALAGSKVYVTWAIPTITAPVMKVAVVLAVRAFN